jgi:hypothetical protein
MSGIEIAVAAAATVSLISSGVSAYSQVQLANQSAEIQSEQIREQQVQLRLAENQSTLERQKKLQQTLATEEVMFGTRHIASGSGTILGIVSQNVHDFTQDENVSALNFGSKKMALAQQKQMVELQRKGQVFGAYTGLLKEASSTALSAAGALGGVPTGAPSGGAAATPSPGAGLNTGGTYGSNQYFNNNFNLNR